MTHITPVAWLVIYGEMQYRALFLEQARAEQFAASSHGTVHPLYLWPPVEGQT